MAKDGGGAGNNWASGYGQVYSYLLTCNNRYLSLQPSWPLKGHPASLSLLALLPVLGLVSKEAGQFTRGPQRANVPAMLRVSVFKTFHSSHLVPVFFTSLVS